MEIPSRTRHERPSSRASSALSTGVLVVDANRDVRELYRDALSANGLQVREAADGREALVQALSQRPRVAVVDARLPFIDGLELCALLHSDPITEATRVIVVTGDPSPEHLLRCRQRGADAVFVKPIHIDALASAVRRFENGRSDNVIDDSVDGLSRSLLSMPAPRVAKARAHERYVSTSPPQPPPSLRCPLCDAALQYDRSHVGGVSDRHPEQWDYFVCSTHGIFQYRHRTRKLRPAS